MCYKAYAYKTRLCAGRFRSFWGSILSLLLLTAVVVIASTNSAWAQSLNWEGQDRIFVTPLAYAVPSADKGFGRPVVAYHYLDAGGVLGGFHQISVTMGVFNRIEFGYTRDLHQAGTADLSDLWSSGFNAFHGKVNLLSERRTWRPALSLGFVARTQVQNVGGVIESEQTNNADFYAVATKRITQIRHLPLVFNVGFKETNASLLGLAGNAPGYQGRVFGAAAFALKGPGRSTILLASEVMQQPRALRACLTPWCRPRSPTRFGSSPPVPCLSTVGESNPRGLPSTRVSPRSRTAYCPQWISKRGINSPLAFLMDSNVRRSRLKTRSRSSEVWWKGLVG